jgi:dethiobiotin synthetase
VGVAKPVQSGNLAADPEGDAMLLKRAAGVDDDPEEICPFAFAAPLAPLVAARLEGRTIDLDAILEHLGILAARHDLLLVEGAGGLLVPVGEDWTIADLACAVGLPLVVVARAGLGTVNHTLLTLEAARRRGLEPAVVILNGRRAGADASVETNAQLIEAFGRPRVVAEIPWLGENATHALPKLVAEYLGLEPLLAVMEREEATRA